MEIHDQINNLRNQMHEAYNNTLSLQGETLSISQQLDQLIVKEMKEQLKKSEKVD